MIGLAVRRPLGFEKGDVRTVDVDSRGNDALAGRDEPGLKFRGVTQVEEGNFALIFFFFSILVSF